MSGFVFTSTSRPHFFEDDPRICFNCLSECESNEKYDDRVRCEDCQREDSYMKDSRMEDLKLRDLRTGVA